MTQFWIDEKYVFDSCPLCILVGYQVLLFHILQSDTEQATIGVSDSTWSVTLGEECRLRVFENRVPRGMFGPNREKVKRRMENTV
jgi:hypothetical protein